MLLSGKKPGETDERADYECMVALLIIKEMRRAGEAWNGTVVAKIRNPRNRRLVSAAEIDDFVISNEICSIVMVQLVRQSGLRGVFEELFDPSGCEIQLSCPSRYRRWTFAGLEVQGRDRGEIVPGWITGHGSHAEVVLNPSRQTPMPPGDDCRIVAIAERL